MEAARVLHFGDDTSHRLRVLRSEGYSVNSYASLQQMISRLRTGQDVDLVCISEEPWCTAEGAVAVARAFSRAPLVLFRANYRSYAQRGWDLEVLPLTPPEVWLRELAELLRSHTGIEAAKLSWAAG
jgi:hypothetical protein